MELATVEEVVVLGDAEELVESDEVDVEELSLDFEVSPVVDAVFEAEELERLSVL